MLILFKNAVSRISTSVKLENNTLVEKIGNLLPLVFMKTYSGSVEILSEYKIC